jgi:3-methyl-2-oxobutanoate hydroxymethyltransferase
VSSHEPAGTAVVELPALAEKKRRGEPIVMVTAYDWPTATAAGEAGVDLVLAGDTAATTVMGYRSTSLVSLEEMVALTRAVRRGLRGPLLVGDLPFGSYEASHELAVRSAQRLVKEGGAEVVKFEGPAPERAAAITAAGIPVMGHLGLTPQTTVMLGGAFKAQARSADAAAQLLDDALSLQDAGCFALVLEAVPAQLGRIVTERLAIPTIGIGAGPDTDGQVLVLNDLLGIFDEFQPRFVKRYAELRTETIAALRAFADDVRSRRFPEAGHCYAMPPGELARLRGALDADR